MEKTKRIITLFLAIVCALALCVTAGAADTSVITDMKTDCVVDAAGSCQITQTVTIDIAGTEDTIELPLAAGAKRISVAGYKYKKTTQDGYTVLVLSSNGGFAGSRTFTISYTVSGLVSEQDNVQTLTLPLLAPTTLFISTIAFTNCFKLADHVIIMTEGAPNNASTLLLYYIYQQGFTNMNYGVSSTLTVIMLVILLIVSVPRFFSQDRKIHYA